MKTIPPPCPEPDNGVKYFRSLEQLSDTPEFQDWASREFPAGASELKDETTRRHFVKIMSASFALAGLGILGAGCRRPEEKIYPFARQPEGYVHGVPQYFATSMPVRGLAVPLLVKSDDGRPTKIEGNATHPDSNGGTDTFAQASVLSLYDADRAQRFTQKGTNASREAAFDFLSGVTKQFSANQGDGLCFLMERSPSPSRARVQGLIKQKFPKARWFIYEPVDFDVQREAATLAAGKPVAPYFKPDAAKVILSLDCDFIGGEEDSHRMIRGFAKGRKISKPGDTMNRLYVVEALMSQTGMNADHRLRVATSQVIAIAAAIAAKISPLLAGLAAKFPLPAGVKPEWIAECAKDLQANPGASLVLAGYRQPLAVHLLANALNGALQNNGKTVEFQEAASSEGSLAQLAELLNGGQVDTLVVLGGNPVYNAPVDLDWAKSQRKAKTVVRLAYYEDETFAACDWHLPAAHYLESWGDARTSDGTLVPVQPLIEPLFGGLTEIEVLARIGGLDATKPHDIARETFKAIAGTDLFEEKWKKFLHDGFLAGSAAKPVEVGAGTNLAALAAATAVEAPSKDKLEVVFTRDYSVDDGRYHNNGWLQELPDPITKMTWDNAVLVSRKTAGELGLKNNQTIKINVGGRSIEAPVWVQPGLADYTLALPLGYGRERSGRIGNFKGGSVGFNAYPLRTSTAMHFASGAKVSVTGATHQFSCTQDHWSMEGRPIIREANLAQFNAHPKFAKNMDMDATANDAFIPKNSDGTPHNIYKHPYESNPALKSQTHQWGMSVDLNSCVGCSACMVACQSENNIPIVGKEQVGKGREMHWIRIDRYYTGLAELEKDKNPLVADDQQQFEKWIDDPQVVTQPMMCQHCESAPCESVCPVNATVHDEEGLNVMAYNRCVGTRYCSNNCAWKVRRFNFFDYNKRPLENLYAGPMATRKNDEWELLKLVKNPDVTVRMRGVMEKCSFCLQRIEQAKISQKVKAGASGDVEVPDGTIKTACQQACPAEAIVFGNILDKKSRVSQLKEQSRDYAVLGFLDTRPRLTYLARVRNPNPAMPDYRELPNSLDEYINKAKNMDPLVEPPKPGAANGKKKGAH